VGKAPKCSCEKTESRFTRINHIFISHLHGDHCFGLMGFVSTLSLLGRTADLHIYGHEDLERIFQPQLNYFCRDMPYRIVFHVVNTSVSELVYEDHKIMVHSIPLKHRIPTCGYLFKEKQSDFHIIKEQIDFFRIPLKIFPE
jgi:ribonuclease Z